MTIYDDKTEGTLESGGCFILPEFNPCSEAVFKASYIVASNMKCDYKITALFDLIVLGDIETKELDVKGRFVCLGNCEIVSSMVVQNEIWANSIRAESIETHDSIIAQNIDSGTIFADGSIIVGKILAVEKLAKTEKNILCGETAYGAGKVIANTIVTGEPLDLDDGTEAITAPRVYRPQPQPFCQSGMMPTTKETLAKPLDLITQGEKNYASDGDFSGYLDFLIMSLDDKESKIQFSRWRNIINEANSVLQSGISKYTNIAMVLWLAEIAGSKYFQSWDKANILFHAFESHFSSLILSNKAIVDCTIGSYNEWLDALSLLSRFGALLDKTVYSIAFELVVSNLGLRSKFVAERLSEKGWKDYAE